MRKTNKRNKNKYSKKTRKNRNLCEKGVTSEVIRLRNIIKIIRSKNKKNLKIKQVDNIETPNEIQKSK